MFTYYTVHSKNLDSTKLSINQSRIRTILPEDTQTSSNLQQKTKRVNEYRYNFMYITDVCTIYTITYFGVVGIHELYAAVCVSPGVGDLKETT